MNQESTALEYHLLSLLNRRPCSGYDLRKAISGDATAHFSDSPGSIYPALRRMELRGWIAPESASAASGRGRTIYRLTPKGEMDLQSWLARPVDSDQVAGGLNELMLRFSAMNNDKDSARLFLQAMESRISEHVDRLRTEVDDKEDEVDCTRLVADHELMMYEATRLWTRRALRRLGDADA